MATKPQVHVNEEYEKLYGFHVAEHSVFKAEVGLDEEKVKQISGMKGEPAWMLEQRLRGYRHFMAKPMPTWANTELLNSIKFDQIYYYLKPTEKQGKTWDDVPEEIKQTFDRLGIPEAERKFLAGVSAQYECLTGDTRVLANPAATPIKDMQPGSYVYSLNEQTKRLEKQRVKRVMAKGERPVYEVVVAGRTIKATTNHPFLALTRTRRPGRQRYRFGTAWTYLSDLNVGDYVAVAKELPDEGTPYHLPPIPFVSTYEGRNQVGAFRVTTSRLLTRRQPSLRVPEQTTEAFMWFLGLFLGDGYIGRGSRREPKDIISIAIPASDEATRKRLQGVMKEVFGYVVVFGKERYRVRIHSKPIVEFLEKLGLDLHAHTKRLPVWAFGLPRSQKLAVLGGFIDADGYVRRTKLNNDASLTSCNRALLEGFHLLAITCGFRVSQIHSFKSSYEYKGKTTDRIGYRMYIYGDLAPLKPHSVRCTKDVTPRRWYQQYAGAFGSPLRAHVSRHLGFAKIQSIRPAGVEPVYDIEVEGSHNFVAEGLIVHNSESVYHSMREDLTKQGVLFLDMDTALKEQPELVQRYFGTVIPPADNKFAALNTAVWSGGSFIYVPKGVKVGMPLQAYFRINAKNMGQFERTLIIADEGSEVTYFEGCTAPSYSSDSLHSAVVELIAMPRAKLRYVTIQNWSKNVYNLVTKRAVAHEGATVQWLDGNLGCLTADAQLFSNPHGPVAIKDVKPEDYVYAVDLNTLEPKKCRVTATRCTGVRQTYRMVTDNHREVKATDNHPFLVVDRQPFSNLTHLEWRPLSALKVGDRIAISRGVPDEGTPKRLEYRYPAVKHGALKHHPRLPLETTEELMWLLGLYVGDGYVERDPANGRCRRVFFAVPEEDRARQKLERLIREIFQVEWKPKGLCVTVNSAIVADFILSIGFTGLAREKRVPSWVFGLPRSQKLAFLEGYLDADGFVRKQKVVGTREYGQLVFASCHKALLEDVKLLLISCGLNPLKIAEYVKERRLYKGRLKEYRCYYLSMNIRESLDAIRSKKVVRAGLDFVPVKSIEPLGEEAVYDIEVEGAHNFIANGVVVHNSRLTMKYPGVYLMGRGAHGEVLSVAFAGDGQHQDAGAKMIHAAPDTSSVITSKSISKGTGRTTYRGLVKVYSGAVNAKSTVRCDALMLDQEARSDTYPTMEIDEKRVQIGHEATVSKIGDEQLFYARSRGLTEQEAMNMIVNGFIEPFVKELPLEYAVELNRLVQLEMEGAVG